MRVLLALRSAGAAAAAGVITVVYLMRQQDSYVFVDITLNGAKKNISETSIYTQLRRNTSHAGTMSQYVVGF